jgi:hypothetical protein
MDVYIELLRGGIDVRALLRDDGWRLLEKGTDLLTAQHPQVSDQEDARDRLLQVGLLTSGEVRIAFGQPILDRR